MSFDYDLIVVGGGPIGCAVARDVAAAGYRVLVAEEHGQVGEPLQCSGLVSARTLEISRVSPMVVLHTLNGARVHAPGGQVLDLAGSRAYALAIDRVRFDFELSVQAAAAGVVIRTGARVTGLELVMGGVRVSLNAAGAEQVLTCRLVIGADGHNSLVARWLGLPSPEPVPLYAAEVELPGYDNHLVDIFLGSQVAPGWFGWVIPAGGGRARVGTGTLPGGRPRACFRLLTGLYPDLFRGMRVLRSTGGLVPVGLRERTCGPHAMLVGDAACQVKPISGGGLYLGLLAAACCAEVAVQALVEGDCSAAFLSRYQQAWEDRIGLEIRCGLQHREVFLGMGDAEMDGIIDFFDKPYWRKLILKYGDLDHHSVIADKLALAPPWAQRFMVNGLKLLLNSGFSS